MIINSTQLYVALVIEFRRGRSKIYTFLLNLIYWILEIVEAYIYLATN